MTHPKPEPALSIRGVLVSPEGLILLIKIAGPRGELWITPGGRWESGEKHSATLRRELREELGLTDFDHEGQIWTRRGSHTVEGGPVLEIEHFYLVHTDVFEPSNAGMEPEELSRFAEFRWWRIEDVRRSEERFAPARLGELLEELVAHGPPNEIIETGD